jgi:uncharacterized protein (TIGR03067 family)
MRRHLLLGLTAGLLVAGQGPKDDAVKQDWRALQGSWTVVSIEVGGAKVPEEKIGGRDAAFKDDQYSIHDFRLTVKIDPTRRPKTIDMEGRDGNGRPLSMTGIYGLDGDTLKICFAKPGAGARPARFETGPRTGASLIVYKRSPGKQ